MGQKKECKSCKSLIYTLFSGEGGIRTPGTSQYNGFQDRRNRPLCHLSKLFLGGFIFKSDAKVHIIFEYTNFSYKKFTSSSPFLLDACHAAVPGGTSSLPFGSGISFWRTRISYTCGCTLIPADQHLSVPESHLQ